MRIDVIRMCQKEGMRESRERIKGGGVIRIEGVRMYHREGTTVIE
jgi:hypothetical protein